MKKFYAILLCGFFYCAHGQQKIRFDYDAAGNQILRELCINCASKTTTLPIQSSETVTENFQKFYEDDAFSYYPNPVKSELFLKWQLIDGKKMQEVTVVAINGQILNSFKRTVTQDNLAISFIDYPQGTYFVIMNYSDGDRKTIKITKV